MSEYTYGRIRKCDHCGKQYVAKHWNSLYCSKNCNRLSYNLRHSTKKPAQVVSCRFCGHTFSKEGTRQVYCSAQCRTQAQRKGMAAPQQGLKPKYKRVSDNIKQCKTCGNNFSAKPPKQAAKYCSDFCRSVARQNDVVYQHLDIRQYQCIVCLADFEAEVFRACCSEECASYINMGREQCATCFEIFDRRYPGQQYCSDNCLRASEGTERDMIEVEARERALVAKGKKRCSCCGDPFRPTRKRRMLCGPCFREG